MPADPGAEIVRTLTAAYRFTEKRRVSAPSGSALLAQVVRIIDIYSENVKVEPLEVISTNELGLVLTREKANVGGQRKTWRAIHIWRFEAQHLTRFEAYGQTLVVLPEGFVATDL
jgi:hypothetical protein